MTSGPDKLNDLTFSIAKLDLKDGDILVVRFPGQITHETACRIQEHLKGLLNGRKAFILDSGGDLTVLTGAEIKRRLEEAA